jgi:hypothetical protein
LNPHNLPTEDRLPPRRKAAHKKSPFSFFSPPLIKSQPPNKPLDGFFSFSPGNAGSFISNTAFRLRKGSPLSSLISHHSGQIRVISHLKIAINTAAKVFRKMTVNVAGCFSYRPSAF